MILSVVTNPLPQRLSGRGFVTLSFFFYYERLTAMSEFILSDVQRIVTQGKIEARRLMPYLCHVFCIMRMTETTKVPTMAVDKYARLYINPDFAASLSRQDCCYILLHEVLHIVLDHPKRFKNFMGDDATPHQQFLCNVAADLCIQQLLSRDCGDLEPDDCVKIEGCVPGTKIPFLSIPGLRRGMAYEQYAQLLIDYMPEEDGKRGGGGDGEGEPKPLDPEQSGSNSDGDHREWEKPQNQTTVAESAQLESSLRSVEDAMQRQEDQSPGSTPGELRQALKTKLHKQPDPFQVLKQIVSASVASPIGTDYETMTRRHRRQRYDAPRKRGIIRYAPDCTIIIDTSGSMSGLESKALTVIAQGLQRVHRPKVVCFDAAVQDKQRMSHISQFSWQGGGGTDMTSAIEMADKEQTDCIVVVTDCETRWPLRKTRAKLVIAAVAEPRSGGWMAPPAWAKIVPCYKEVNTYAY